jgi:hypothetical protein
MKFYCKTDRMYHCKSELPRTLQPFFDYVFSSGGYIGDDFKSFSTKYRNAIKKLLPNGYEIHTWNKDHYWCSAVIKTPEEKFVYINTSDVRYFPNEWATNILYRTMEHDKDWHGGPNHYTSLFTFTKDIENLYR